MCRCGGYLANQAGSSMSFMADGFRLAELLAMWGLRLERSALARSAAIYRRRSRGMLNGLTSAAAGERKPEDPLADAAED